MSLTDALSIIGSAFTTNAAQSAIIARNVANAGVQGYSREVANVVTNGFGGADVQSVTRVANSALTEQLLSSTSSSASQQALATGLSTLAQTVSDSASASSTSGANANGASPSAMLAKLQNALQTYEASPSNTSVGQAVVTAAANLASSLNSASATIQQVRSQADASMNTAVNTVNSLLGQFQSVNNEIVSGLRSGANVASAQDQRDSILQQLSQQIGISTVDNPDGSMSIYTDSGVTLFQGGLPRTLSFTPTATLPAGVNGSPVMVEGVPITGPSAPMAIHSGALAGLVQLRDTVAPQYQAQLDQIAGGLIQTFSESDQSATPTQPNMPGLFTYPGATGVPSLGATTGLASVIQVNPNVDPAQGGNVNLLRDGGISNPGSPTYTYNTTGSAGYTGRIQQLIDGISTTLSFDPTAGLAASQSLSSYAGASVSWVQGQNQQASTQADYQKALASQASSALSNATGVNLDAELTNMLNIENSYTSTAKLLNTANTMFSALLNSV
jgi:flagellar hook-associated protein 1 FlgK